MKDKKMTNKEYLICIDTKLKDLKEQFSNHLQHHVEKARASLAINIALLTVTGGAITALILALL